MAYMIYYGSDVLFDPIGDDSVTDCKITASSNNPDYLDFTISYGHSLYSTIAERAAIVKVFWDDTCLFIGEIESIDIDYEGNKDVSCNGALAWLEDTLVRPYSTVSGEQPLTAPSSVNGLFQWYIDQYNEHAYSANHPFNVDTNQGAALDSNNYIYRSSSSTATVWSEISSKILDELGGYLFLDYGDGTSLTLNLYADVHEMNSQIIDFGVNVTDFSKSIETSSQYTAIRPSGYTPSAPEDDPNKKMFPITIESVTDGATSYDTNLTKHGDVIYSIDAIRRYGYREYGYSDTDIETVDGLMQAACKALNKILSPELSITVKAVDLALYMEGYTHLRVGQAVRIRSAFHDTDEYLMVSSITLNLNNPGSTEYELGTSYDSLTGQQSSYMKSLNSGINTALDTTATLSDDVKSAATEAKDAATAAAEAASQAASAQSTATEAKDAADSASSTATEAKNTAEKTASDLTTAVSDLQKQIDGSIETWFYEVEPTTDNEPAVNWTTDAEKNKHLGDLYYDTKTGYCYRWQIQNGTYSWGRIADTDVAKALEAAKTAKDVADHKRTIFVDTPTVPYDIGDMWVQGENGDILVATVSKASTETYSAKDWVVASKYTDDSLAQVAKDTADKAVIETTTEYTTTSSPTTVPTDDAEWDPATPAYEEGKYIWMHQIVTYGDGTTETTKPVLVTGNDGYSPTVSIDKQNDKTVITITDKTGDHTGTISDGTSVTVKSATTTYQAGTSATSIPTGEWKDISKVTVPQGGYLWSKTVVTYSDGTSTNAYGVSYSAKDGADGASVSAVKIQYYKSTSSTTQTGGNWQDSVPDWESGKYIWQRTQTTIGGKTVTGNPVLYGAFNSLATSVEGNTSSIQQLPSKLEAKFVTLDADRLSGDDWIKDPYFLNGATNTDKWNGSVTLAVGSKTQSGRYSYWQLGAALRKVSKGQKLRLALTADDTGCTTGTNVGLGFRVANASKVWQTWITPLQLGTTHSATHTGSYIYTVPDVYDGYYFAPFTQLSAASSTTTSTGTCVFSYIQITDITAAATDYSTLIRATSDGIEVGKTDTSGTLSGVHTLIGTDTFSIHTQDHKVMSSVDANKFTFASGEAYVGKSTTPTEAGNSAFGIFSTDNQPRPIALVPGRNGNTDDLAYIYVWPSDTAGDLAYASLRATKDDYSRWSFIETTYLNATLEHIADDTVTSLDVGKGYVDIRSDDLMFSKSTAGSAEFTIAMDTFRDYLKPKVWRFGEYARGTSQSSTLGTGWVTASYMQRVRISGPSNYTDYFKFVSGVITAVKAGYFRVRFHLTCKHTGSGGRYGAAVMMGSTYGDVSFQYSNSSIDYNDCVAEYVDYLSVGSTMTVKEHATTSNIVKNLDGNRSNVTVEYLGA